MQAPWIDLTGKFPAHSSNSSSAPTVALKKLLRDQSPCLSSLLSITFIVPKKVWIFPDLSPTNKTPKVLLPPKEGGRYLYPNYAAAVVQLKNAFSSLVISSMYDICSTCQNLSGFTVQDTAISEPKCNSLPWVLLCILLHSWDSQDTACLSENRNSLSTKLTPWRYGKYYVLCGYLLMSSRKPWAWHLLHKALLK